MRKHVLTGADMKLKNMDYNKDGKISWDEYVAVEYDPSTEQGVCCGSRSRLLVKQSERLVLGQKPQ